jgi:hypothetical protein
VRNTLDGHWHCKASTSIRPATGHEGLLLARSDSYELTVVDRMLPALDAHARQTSAREQLEPSRLQVDGAAVAPPVRFKSRKGGAALQAGNGGQTRLLLDEIVVGGEGALPPR